MPSLLTLLRHSRSFVPTSSGADCAGAAADPHRLRGGGGLLPARAELPAPAAGRECRNSDIDINSGMKAHYPNIVSSSKHNIDVTIEEP